MDIRPSQKVVVLCYSGMKKLTKGNKSEKGVEKFQNTRLASISITVEQGLQGTTLTALHLNQQYFRSENDQTLCLLYFLSSG